MEFVQNLIEIFLHLDVHLGELTAQYGTFTYAILFFVIFAETGFVFTPFLPGDSLLFAMGTLAALGSLNVYFCFFLVVAAALSGDNVNYWVGHFLGIKILKNNSGRFIKKEYLVKTGAYFEKYGGKTIIIARFVPIVRTFTPFTAGIGRMNYFKFISYSIAGALLWSGLLVFLGYYFGNLPFIKKNFSLAILVVILISILPAIIEIIRAKFRSNLAK
ncbi:MAG: DedA family protein [Ignavibacteriaceae bacterium]